MEYKVMTSGVQAPVAHGDAADGAAHPVANKTTMRPMLPRQCTATESSKDEEPPLVNTLQFTTSAHDDWL